MRIEPRPRSVVEVGRSLAGFREWHALRTYFLAQVDWMQSRRRQRSTQFDHSVPWWSYGCTTFLDQVVSTDARILELGAGGSTLWWLERGNRVTSIEGSSEWAKEVAGKAATYKDRLDLVGMDADDHEAIRRLLEGQSFDVLVIDHSGDRPAAVRFLRDLVAPIGMLILDNSDRAEYAAVLDDLRTSGFQLLDFAGLGPINAFAGTTTLAVRSGITIAGRRPALVTVAN